MQNTQEREKMKISSPESTNNQVFPSAMELRKENEPKVKDEEEHSDDHSSSEGSVDSFFGSDPLKKRIGYSIKDLITLLGWIACTGVFIWYFYSSITQTVEAFQNPATTVSYKAKTPMYFPAVTLCNWNPDDEEGGNKGSKFEAVGCYRTVVSPNNVSYVPCEFPYYEKTIFSGVYYMNCIVFNNDTSAPAVASRTGHTGSLVFKARFPFDFFGEDDMTGFRAGATVSFHEVGSVPNLSDETNTASGGLDNTFTIRKMVNKRLVPNPTTEIYWDSDYSAIDMIENRTDYITVTVAYNSLNIREQTDVYTVNILQLLGQLAGMTGTLYGLEILKVLRGCLWIPKSIKKKTAKYIWEEFNR